MSEGTTSDHGAPVAGEAGPALPYLPPESWEWMRHVEDPTWHIYANEALSAHCDHPVPGPEWTVELGAFAPNMVMSSEKVCEGCAEAPAPPEVFTLIGARLDKVRLEQSELGETPLCEATGCRIPGEKDPQTGGYFCAAYHLGIDLSVRREFHLLKHPELRKKPQKSTKLKSKKKVVRWCDCGHKATHRLPKDASGKRSERPYVCTTHVEEFNADRERDEVKSKTYSAPEWPPFAAGVRAVVLPSEDQPATTKAEAANG